MEIATWNVNSLKVRLDQVVAWLGQNPVDILCLQELKLVDELFPATAFADLGYRAWWRGQKGYNGVAMVSRLEGSEQLGDLPGVDPLQRRFLALTFGDLRVVCVYAPNGGELDSDKYAFKRQWLAAMEDHLTTELSAHRRFVLLGDMNIAPHGEDVHNPGLWEQTPIHSPEMQASFQRLTGHGERLIDCFRQLNKGGGHYSWWDYRMGGYARNLGLRIDHILASKELAGELTVCRIDRQPREWPRPSDHAPVVARFG